MKPDDPRMDAVDCDLARLSYAHGQNGIDVAAQWITAHVSAILAVQKGRAADPMAFPGFGNGTPEETARRIVARLLDAGWRPADPECLTASIEPEGDAA